MTKSSRRTIKMDGLGETPMTLNDTLDEHHDVDAHKHDGFCWCWWWSWGEAWGPGGETSPDAIFQRLGIIQNDKMKVESEWKQTYSDSTSWWLRHQFERWYARLNLDYFSKDRGEHKKHFESTSQIFPAVCNSSPIKALQICQDDPNLPQNKRPAPPQRRDR